MLVSAYNLVVLRSTSAVSVAVRTSFSAGTGSGVAQSSAQPGSSTRRNRAA
ncbi:hypothetical protein ACFQQB_18650 [Nonomuraea rubra]|uniref:hypothetical protein n=1 Tax=Nonomuraea rubra TaxID=46180 RepID=UPI003617AC83